MTTYTTEERHRLTGECAREQNKPYKEAVTINCAGIGDDNDYSCLLGQVVYELWKTKRVELAYAMYLTDPMLMEWKSREEFEEEMLERDKAEEEYAW